MDELQNECTSLINSAHTTDDMNEKINYLSSVLEILFQRDPKHILLPSLFPHIVSFQVIQHVQMHRFLLTFLEKALNISSIYYEHLYTIAHTILSSTEAANSIKKYMISTRRHFRKALAAIQNENQNGNQNGKDKDLEKVWNSILTFIEFLQTRLGTEEMWTFENKMVMYTVKSIELIILTLSEASDHEFRDPARSNVDPDEMNIIQMPVQHPILNRNLLLEVGESLVQIACTTLLKSVKVTNVTEDEYGNVLRICCVLINSLSLIASLRPGLVNAIMPTLIAYERKTRELINVAPIWNVIRMTLRGNFLRLLRLPTLKHHADSLVEVLEVLDAVDQAASARQKSKVTRRKYVATPLQHIRGDVGKRASQLRKKIKTQSSSSPMPMKRKAESSSERGMSEEQVLALPLESLVDMVLSNMNNEKKKIQKGASLCKKSLVDLLMQLPDGDGTKRRTSSSSSRKVKSLLTPVQVEGLVNHIQHKNTRIDVAAIRKDREMATSEKKKAEKHALVQVTADNSIKVSTLDPVTDIQFARNMAHFSIERILHSEQGALICGQSVFRERLLARLVTNRWISTPDSNLQNGKKDVLTKPYPLILKFIGERFRTRFELAMYLLVHEFAQGSTNIFFEPLLVRFVNLMQSTLDPSIAADRTLYRQIIHQLPDIPVSILQVIVKGFEAPSGIVLAITTLRDLVSDRPVHIGRAALMVLLHYTTHADRTYRNPTIRCVANQLYGKPHLQISIEQYAQRQIQVLLGGDSSPVEKNMEVDPLLKDSKDAVMCTVSTNMSLEHDVMETTLKELVVEEQGHVTAMIDYVETLEEETTLTEEGMLSLGEDDVLQRLELYLALCAKKMDLFQLLVKLYGATSSDMTRAMIYASIKKLVIHCKQKDGEEKVVAQLKGFTMNALCLVTHVIEICCQEMIPSEILLSSVVRLYEESRDAMILDKAKEEDIKMVVSMIIPILPGISRVALGPLLIPLVSLPEEQMEMAFSKLLNVIPMPVDPAALLTDLHAIDVTTEPLLQKRVIKAIDMCRSKTSLFTMEVFGIVLNELVEKVPIPRLTLRTMIVSVTLHPKLKQVMLNLCEKLIVKHIWEMDTALWTGFRKCMTILQPDSFTLLLKLPVLQLEAVLSEENLKDLFLEAIASSSTLYEAASEQVRTVFELVAPVIIKEEKNEVAVEEKKEVVLATNEETGKEIKAQSYSTFK